MDATTPGQEGLRVYLKNKLMTLPLRRDGVSVSTRAARATGAVAGPSAVAGAGATSRIRAIVNATIATA